MNSYEQLRQFENEFGLTDDIELIHKIKTLIENPTIDSIVKSKGLCLIGNIICYLSPWLEDDNGYRYFEEALNLDSCNYDALLGICSIFNTYPYPFNTILSEVKYLDCIQKLIDSYELLDDRQHVNLLQSLKSYSLFRKKIIKKYGYPHIRV